MYLLSTSHFISTNRISFPEPLFTSFTVNLSKYLCCPTGGEELNILASVVNPHKSTYGS